MGNIIVEVNRRLLASIPTDGNNVVSVFVGGNVTDESLADINANAGFYGGDVENRHLIYIDHIPLTEFDEVSILFSKLAAAESVGRTIDELYTDEDANFESCETDEGIIESLEKKQKYRDGYSFRLLLPSGEVEESVTVPDTFGFNFSVLWNWKNAESVRVALSSSSLKEIADRKNGSCYAQLRIGIGDRVVFNVKGS